LYTGMPRLTVGWSGIVSPDRWGAVVAAPYFWTPSVRATRR